MRFLDKLIRNRHPSIGGRYEPLEIGDWILAIIAEDAATATEFAVAAMKRGEERFRSPHGDPDLAVPGVDWSTWETGFEQRWPVWQYAPAASVQALVDHLERAALAKAGVMP